MQLEGPSLRQDPLGKRGDAHPLCFLQGMQTTEPMGSNTPRRGLLSFYFVSILLLVLVLLFSLLL